MTAKDGKEPPADPAGDGKKDGDGGQALATRVDAIEAKQEEHGGMLQKILDRLPGGDAPKDGSQGDSSSGASGSQGRDPVDIQAEVRKEIAEADKRRKAEEKDKADSDWRADVSATLEKVKAEQAPREPVTGLRGRLQRALLGGDR